VLADLRGTSLEMIEIQGGLSHTTVGAGGLTRAGNLNNN